MNDEVVKEIEAVAGKITSIALLDEQGCTSEVRRVVAGERSYILKSATKELYRLWLRNEAKVLSKLPQEELPVPTAYGFFEELDRSHLLMSLEEGVSLTAALNEATPHEKEHLYRSFGQFLHDFHERCPLPVLKRENDWLEDQLKAAESHLARGECDGDLTLLESLKRNRPGAVLQTMIHGDCTTDNVLVKDGQVWRFIDVSGMTVGDPRYDESLAIRKINEPGDLEAFYKGYTRYRVSREEFIYFDQGLYEFF